MLIYHLVKFICYYWKLLLISLFTILAIIPFTTSNVCTELTISMYIVYIVAYTTCIILYFAVCSGEYIHPFKCDDTSDWFDENFKK